MCKNSGSHVARVKTFCTAAPNTCGPSPRNLFNVTLLAPRILRWPLEFWIICAPLTDLMWSEN